MLLKSIHGLLAGLLVGLFGANVDGATIPLYENNVQLTISPPAIAPQIDAQAFVNNSVFSVTTTGGFIPINAGVTLAAIGLTRFPFETSNTRFYTNNGQMYHGDGFRIDRQSGTSRTWLNGFDNQGTIESGLVLDIAATNIHSSGIISSPAVGLLRISGKDVDFQDGGIRTGITTQDPVTYLSTAYWGAGANQVMSGPDTDFNINGPNFQLPYPFSPPHQVFALLGGAALPTTVQVPNFAFGDSYNAFVNIVGTNIQVVFAPISLAAEPAMRITVRFGAGNANTGARTPVVEFALPEYDPVTDSTISHNLYFSDASLAPLPGATALAISPYGGQMPSVYTLSSTPPIAWLTGVPANNVLTGTTFYDSTLVTNRVTNTYSAYAANYGPLNRFGVGVLPDVTNRVGRVELTADSLNATDLRVRAESMFLLKAKNLVDGELPIVDAPFVGYDIGSTTGSLTLKNLAPPVVRRFSGLFAAWSIVWNNQTTNVPPSAFQYHVLILENVFDGMTTTVIDSLAANATNVIVSGAADTVERRLVINAKSLTVDSSGSLGYSSTTDRTLGITVSNAPTLINFTNRGTISVPGIINLGFDRPLPITNFLNEGQIRGGGVLIRSRNFANTGSLIANAGSVDMDFFQGVFTRNGIYADSNIRVRGNELVVSNSFLSSGYLGRAGKLDFAVTNRFTDLGSNYWRTTEGFLLGRLPVASALFGTTIESVVGKFKNPTHIWASTNLGPVDSGFLNNAVLGRLILNAVTNFAQFTFSGIGNNSAIYVDYLELKNFATNYPNVLSIAPNFTIYFADSNLKAEELDGALGGRLRWVSSFAGPNSSVTVTNQSGVRLQVNRQLVTSTTIDSDGDGINNASDPFPFEFTGPSFSAQPTNQTVNVGSTLLVSAGVQGTPPLVYQWRRNGVVLKGATNAILSIPNVQIANSGSYQVVVGNGTATVTSSAAVITVINPFVGRSGAYSGLFGNPASYQFPSSGFAQLSLTLNGAFSGQLRIAGGSYSFAGKFDPAGASTFQVSRLGKSPLLCQFNLDLVGSNTITGTVGDSIFLVPIHLDRAVFSASRPAPYAGRYTLAIPGASPVTGDGFGTLTISSLGAATFSGSLADGTVVSQTAKLSESGVWPVYLPLYTGQGMLISAVQFSTNPPVTLHGNAVWSKNAVGGKYFPLGFRLDTSVDGNAYTPPPSGVRVLNLTNATITLSSGNLVTPLTSSAVLGANNLLTITGPNSLKLSVTVASGLVNGSFKHPITTLVTPVRGIVRQGTNLMQGYFLGTDESGTMTLLPAP